MAVATIGAPIRHDFSQLFIFLLAAAFVATVNATGRSSGRRGVAKVGPAFNWLVRVPLEEREEIARKCSPTPAALRHSGAPTAIMNATSNASSQSLEQRIFDGERAPRGSFKYAAALALRRAQIGDRWGAACGATFVSRRHLLTAAHCISSQQAISNSLALLVGGVCLNPRDIDDCPGAPDMVEVGVEFSIAPYFFQSMRDRFKDDTPDIAIIQLDAPVADNGRVEAACLPAPSDPLPQYLTAFGWGRRGDLPADFYPNHLRYVEGSTQPLPQWTAGLGQRPECQPALTRLFCLFAVRGQRMNGTTYFGDSGAGVVWPALRVQATGAPATLYGISSTGDLAEYSLNEAAGEPRQKRFYGIETDVGSYLAELCYYLELCGGDGPVRSVYSALHFGSVYLKRPRSTLPPLGPLSLIRDKEDALNQLHCVGTAAIYGGNVPPSKPSPDFTWAAALVDTGEKPPRLVCTATLVSSQHLLVSRFCLLAYMISHSRTQSSNTGGQPSTPRVPRLQVSFVSGSQQSAQTLYPVEFVAWLSKNALSKGSIHSPENSELAIVQLQARKEGGSIVDIDIHHPACTESELNAAGYGSKPDGETVASIAYWWSSGAENAELRREVVELSGKYQLIQSINATKPELTTQSDLLLVTRPLNTTPTDADSIHNHGAGLVDTRNYCLLGLVAYAAGPNYYNYFHAWEYRGTLCLYLSVGCSPNEQSGASYVDNRMPYFNRFLYFD